MNGPIRSCVMTLARFMFSKVPRVPFHRRVSCYERSQFSTECLRNSSKRILAARARGGKKIRTSCIVENVPLEKIGPLWEEDGRNDARGKNEVKVGKGIYGGGTERRHGWERKNTEEHRFRCNASYVILLSVNRSRVFRPDINISASQSRPSTFVKEGRLFVKYVTAILCHSSLLFLRPRLLRTIRDIIHDIPMQRI